MIAQRGYVNHSALLYNEDDEQENIDENEDIGGETSLSKQKKLILMQQNSLKRTGEK